MIILTVVAIVCALVYAFLKWNYSHFKRLGIPGPEPSFFFGNVKDVFLAKKQLGQLCHDWYNQYPDYPYIGYYGAFRPNILLRDPELVRRVLIDDYQSFSANDFPTNPNADKLLQQNPFMLTGETWKRSRLILSQLFTPNKIKTLFPLMQLTCEKMEKYIKQFEKTHDFDVKDLSAKYTTDNVIQCAFSINAESFTDNKSEFREMGKKIFKPSFWTAIKFTIMFFLPQIVKTFPISFLSKDFEEWYIKFLKANMDSRKTKKLSHEDLLQMLVGVSEKIPMETMEMFGHSLSFFIDGYETSSTLLSFALYEMARHPDIQQRARDEINKVLQTHDEKLSVEAINEMKYLDSVMNETLRLNPVAFIMRKTCTKEYELPKLSKQDKPYVLPVNSSVSIAILALHKDAVYYPEPEKFNPDRFTPEENQVRHKGVYISFGEGPRICPGMKFGLIQTKAAMITILKSFNVKISPNCKPFRIDPRSLMNQAIDPLLLNFEYRQ